MSDYLSNLAARALDLANVVQPSPMPLFAPSPPLIGWPPAEQSEMDMTEYQLAPLGTAPVRAAPSQLHAPIERAGQPAAAPQPAAQHQHTPHKQPPAQATLYPTDPAAVPVSPATQPLLPAVPPTPPEHVLIERVAATVPLLPAQTAPQFQPALAPPTERLVIERVISAPAAPIQEPSALPIQAAQPNPIVKEVTIERIIEPAPQKDHSVFQPSETSATKHPSPMPPMLVQPRITPARHHEQAPPAPATPAPTIQVTIGRIEVRASAPTAQPRTPRAAQPTMSLEDYLKSRSGGGR